MWKLVIEDDEGKRTVVPLSRDDYTIGRQEGNTIRLTERNVSRQHGRIRRRREGANGGSKDTFVLEDQSSYNGVFVNGLRVATTQDLQHGDLVQIGDYRIVLQDDAASAVETAAMPLITTEPDAKATIPMAGAFRGSLLTERPNRMVMLVGPTPGMEFPLDRERMTIGRAEDASISVNHNSVSRLHCEVHALGDGRFEIVDKGSSNGVRVNGVELKRSIIEAGDVIELGDVRFKFVGAGQVFVPGPNESQQLAAISDREAEIVDPNRRSLGGYALPIALAVVLGVLILTAVSLVMRARVTADPLGTASSTHADADGQVVMSARQACTIDDCETAHRDVTTKLAPQSPWRESADFQLIERTWADSLLRKALGDIDVAQKRALLQRVASTVTVDALRRKTAVERLAALDGTLPDPTAPVASQLQIPSTVPSQAPVDPPIVGDPVPSSRVPPAHPTLTTASLPSAPVAPPRPAGGTVIERARAASGAGESQQVRNLLEFKVRSGHASAEEVNLVKKACQGMQDFNCVTEIKAKYPQLYPQ